MNVSWGQRETDKSEDLKLPQPIKYQLWSSQFNFFKFIFLLMRILVLFLHIKKSLAELIAPARVLNPPFKKKKQKPKKNTI